ncbi:MAG: CopD family protein, partial [PS1 clade bacterium]
HLVKVFKSDQNTRSDTFYRWFNEFPALILVAIIILIVVKPF